jgi:putative redox protein
MSRAVTVSGGPSSLRQVISVGRHQLFADEPMASGGHDEGPEPYELLLSALGSCTNMTLRMYADRKGWPLKEIRVVLTHSKNYAKDSVNCEQPAAMLDRIDRRITLIGELSAEQRQAVASRKHNLLLLAQCCSNNTIPAQANLKAIKARIPRATPFFCFTNANETTNTERAIRNRSRPLGNERAKETAKQ